MISLRDFGLGVLTATLTIVGCASSSFPWHYYTTQMEPSCYEGGQLLGKQGSGGWADQSLKLCEPDDQVKAKCITVQVDDFFAIKADNEKCHQELDSCQHGN